VCAGGLPIGDIRSSLHAVAVEVGPGKRRISVQPGDMWHDAFPAADVHFYSDIFHDWPPERCRALAQKSFTALEPGGRIVLHEMIYNDRRTGPAPVAAYNTAMLLWTTGQQYARRELTSMLTAAGFRNIEVRPSFGYWHIITGTKPHGRRKARRRPRPAAERERATLLTR
jgi:hypothetical protein